MCKRLDAFLTKKSTIFVLFIIAIGLTVSMPKISAYLMDMAEKENRMNIGINEIAIVETFNPPKELKPGVSFTKDVAVKNLGDVACFVRVKAVFANSDMADMCTVNWNTTNWVYDAADNYYYYTGVLEDGAITPSLMTTVKIKDNANEAMIKDFDIIIYAESYQAVDTDTSAYFTNYQKAWEKYRKNKPVT